MDTFRKIDQIRRRLGVAYEEAYKALEECNGDLISALIKLEKEQKQAGKHVNVDVLQVKGQELLNKIKGNNQGRKCATRL